MDKLRDPIPRIVDAVAEAEDVDPIRLKPPLAGIVDPDALETLIEDSTASDLKIHFAYCGHDVVVDESGRVQID